MLENIANSCLYRTSVGSHNRSPDTHSQEQPLAITLAWDTQKALKTEKYFFFQL